MRDLISWEKTEIKKILSLEKIYEPVFTCKMNTDVIRFLRDEPFSVHTQSCERAVREVSKPSCAVYGEKRRDGWARARNGHRGLA